jgi:hypothetical protein
MATVTCDLNSQIQRAKCFGCFSQKENMAAIVYFLEQRRAALAGQTPQTPLQVRTATKCLNCLPMDPVADAQDAAVAQAGAIAAGVAGASTQTIAQIRAAINSYANMSLDDLRTAEVYLRCQLNAYP